ncbi:MAG: hypothetical protein AAB493_02315 [Patescibacteria group bacterium]
MKKNLHIIIFTSFFLLGYLVFQRYSFAFEKTKIDILPQNDFVVEPGKTEVFLDGGETVIKSITVTNRIDRKIRFKLSTEDFIGTENKEQPLVLLGDENSPYSLKDFIIPEIKEFELELGERITIPIKISIPIDAEPRGYYGALIVSNDPSLQAEENSKEIVGKTKIISRIGSLFLLKINGEGKEEGSIEDFKTIGPKKIFYEKRPDGFEIAFKNSGNVHLVPYGTITIRNLFGATIKTLPVDAYFVLPDSIRYREIKWTDGFSLGRYTAVLSLNKGYGNEYDNAKLAFWILPWKILLMIFVGISLIVATVYYLLTRFELRKK